VAFNLEFVTVWGMKAQVYLSHTVALEASRLSVLSPSRFHCFSVGNRGPGMETGSSAKDK